MIDLHPACHGEVPTQRRESLSDHGDLRSKNRVWDFFWKAESRVGKSENNPSVYAGENWVVTTKSRQGAHVNQGGSSGLEFDEISMPSSGYGGPSNIDINLYIFVGNNPINGYDEHGLMGIPASAFSAGGDPRSAYGFNFYQGPNLTPGKMVQHELKMDGMEAMVEGAKNVLEAVVSPNYESRDGGSKISVSVPGKGPLQVTGTRETSNPVVEGTKESGSFVEKQTRSYSLGGGVNIPKTPLNGGLEIAVDKEQLAGYKGGRREGSVQIQKLTTSINAVGKVGILDGGKLGSVRAEQKKTLVEIDYVKEQE